MRKYFLLLGLLIFLGGGVAAGLYLWRDRKDAGKCVDLAWGEKAQVCGQKSTDGKSLKVLNTDKVKRVFEYLAEKGVKRAVSKVYVYLVDSPDIKIKLEGRRDPESGDLLTAYGWEYEKGVLRIPIYVRADYLGKVDEKYWDAMVCASVWYFLTENRYWTKRDDFGAKVFRDFYYNDLVNYGKTIEIN